MNSRNINYAERLLIGYWAGYFYYSVLHITWGVSTHWQFFCVSLIQQVRCNCINTIAWVFTLIFPLFRTLFAEIRTPLIQFCAMLYSPHYLSWASVFQKTNKQEETSDCVNDYFGLNHSGIAVFRFETHVMRVRHCFDLFLLLLAKQFKSCFNLTS